MSDMQATSEVFSPIALGKAAHRERLIGRWDEDLPGPLVIALGAVHGNEPAGVQACERLLAALAREHEVAPGFAFHGRFTAFVGNVSALALGRRFMRCDLNRHLAPETLDQLASLNSSAEAASTLHDEDAEALALWQSVAAEVEAYQPERVIVVDLHTTTANGGAFTIPGKDAAARKLGLALHAPVLLGMLQGLSGTTLHAFTTERLGMPTTGLVFESGQHTEPAAVDRAESALTLLLHAAGCVAPKFVSSRHATRLREEFAALPALVQLTYVHRITPQDRFLMRPGYVNFQPIKAGEALADDIHGEVLAPSGGRILMPLYQPQGGEGFFIVEQVAQPAAAATK